MTIEQLYALFLKFPKISTDTRTITKDGLFFALKGDNFNGNKFAAEALEKGAAYGIVDEERYATSDKLILVDDVLKTLQKLANYHRNHCDAQILALTGSNGKTTTKELIRTVLSKKYHTIATEGNLNNHIGVPLTLLSIDEDTEMAVVEMGANHLGEIAFLCQLAQPDFGYITNFGKAHLEGFGSEEGVIRGKSELYDYLITNGKGIFMNGDDSVQLQKLSGYVKKYGFSTKDPQYYTIEFLGANPFVELKVEDTTITSQLIGSYNFTNSAAGILIGKYFNIPLPDIKRAIESYIPGNNRSQMLQKSGHTIILDAYNANPTSMEAALKNFETIKERPKVVFLGDMFELGATVEAEHQSIANLAATLDLDAVYLIGENFQTVKTPFKTFDSLEGVKVELQKNGLPQKSHILIKGSRGMALERLLESL